MTTTPLVLKYIQYIKRHKIRKPSFSDRRNFYISAVDMQESSFSLPNVLCEEHGWSCSLEACGFGV